MCIRDSLWTTKELANAVAIKYKKIESRLDDFFDGVSEEEATYKPAHDEWSLKGNIAHFIQGERGFHTYIDGLVSGYERFADDYGGNEDVFIEATIAAYPTLQDMIQEYKRNKAETLNILANLPDDFVARKGSYWRLAHDLLQDPYHFDSHMEQMQVVLEAARAE